MDCSLPGSSIHGIFQARVLEWVATDRDKCRLRTQAAFLWEEVTFPNQHKIPIQVNDVQQSFLQWSEHFASMLVTTTATSQPYDEYLKCG